MKPLIEFKTRAEAIAAGFNLSGTARREAGEKFLTELATREYSDAGYVCAIVREPRCRMLWTKRNEPAPVALQVGAL